MRHAQRVPWVEPTEENGIDNCPEHGPHDQDYCPGCTRRAHFRKRLRVTLVMLFFVAVGILCGYLAK